MDLSNALLASAQRDYGILNPAIAALASQLSLGVSVPQALHGFSKEIRDPHASQCIHLIEGGYHYGYHHLDATRIAADEAREYQLLTTEQQLHNLFALCLVYMASILGLIVIALLATQQFPTFISSAADTISGTTSLFENQDSSQLLVYAGLIQTGFTGIAAGFIENGSLRTSLKHISLLLFLSWITFSFLGAV